MPRAQWSLTLGRPIIEIILIHATSGQSLTRSLLADTGAGNVNADFELLLLETDCLACGGKPSDSISIVGAYNGTFPLYLMRVKIPLLAFDDDVLAIGATSTPPDLHGIACFRFLNRFTYGNFGSVNEFALET
jgi:hypothetical protein